MALPIVNAGFESAPDLTGWTVPAGTTASVTTTGPHGGTKSGRVDADLDAGTGVRRLIRQDVNATAGKTYTVTGWISTTDAGGNAHIEIQFLDSANTAITTDVSSTPAVTGSSGWTQVSIGATAPSGTAHLRIKCSIYPGTAVGGTTPRAKFDDLSGTEN